MTKTNPGIYFGESLLYHPIGTHLSLTSQNLMFGSDGASLIVITDLQSWSSILWNPSVLHSEVPSGLQGLCGCAQLRIHPQGTWAFIPLPRVCKRNQEQMPSDFGRTKSGPHGGDLGHPTCKMYLSFRYGRWLNMKMRNLTLKEAKELEHQAVLSKNLSSSTY